MWLRVPYRTMQRSGGTLSLLSDPPASLDREAHGKPGKGSSDLGIRQLTL